MREFVCNNFVILGARIYDFVCEKLIILCARNLEIWVREFCNFMCDFVCEKFMCENLGARIWVREFCVREFG